MEEYNKDSTLNKIPTSSQSADGKITLSTENKNVSEQVRVCVNNKGHKVKVIKIKDEIPHNILRPKTGLRSVPKVSTKKSVERVEVISPDNKRLVQLKSTEVADIGRVVSLKLNDIADENIEPKDIGSENLQLNTNQQLKENKLLYRESKDCAIESGIFNKEIVLDNQDLEERPKRSKQLKSTLTTQPRKSGPTVVPAKPEKTYDRQEMKAYIKAKRKHQAQKRAEEERLRQEALEVQRSKLEQLKEVSQTIVKKCVKKLKEEEKPEWSGPLEADEDDTLKRKYNLKVNDSVMPETKRQKFLLKPSINYSTKLRKSKPKEVHTVEGHLQNDKLTSGCDGEKNYVENTCKNVEPLVIPDDLPNLSEKINTSNKIKILELHNKPLYVANNLAPQGSTNQAATHSKQNLATPNNTNRSHLLQSKSWHGFSESGLHSHNHKIPSDIDKNNICGIIEPAESVLKSGDTIEKTSPIKIHQQGSHTKLRYKPRHFLRSSVQSDCRKGVTETNDSKGIRKAIVESDSESYFSGGPITELTGATSNNVVTADDLQSTPQWMKSFLNQPNPFKFINIVKLKLASQQKEQILQLQKLKDADRKSHVEIPEDMTDAPSIESMEDDFKLQHTPLKLSDLKLNLPSSLNSESLSYTPTVNNIELNDSNKPSESSVKSVLSSEETLFIPVTIQSLTLKSNLDLTSVSLNSVSEEMGIVQGLIPPKDTLLDWKKVESSVKDPEPGVLSPTGDDQSKIKSDKIQQERFKIGKVFTPSALQLQFQAELNKLDVFDHSISQVMATQRLRALMSRTPHLVPKLTSSKVLVPPQTEGAQDFQEEIDAPLNVPESSITSSHSKKTFESNKTTMRESTSSCSKTPTENIPSQPKPSRTQSRHSDASKSVLSDHSSQHSETINTQISEHISCNHSNCTSLSERISQSKSLSCDDIKVIEKEEFKGSSSNKHTNMESVNISPSSTLLESSLVTLHSINEVASVEPTLIEEEAKESSNINNGSLENTKPSRADKRHSTMNEYSLQVFEQLIKDEDLRTEHQKAVLKLRQKALVDRAKAEVAMIQIQKQKLRDRGHTDLVTNLKKKQRGILLKMKQDQDEIHRIMKREMIASQERKLALTQQLQIIKMHLSTRNMVHKFKSSDNLPKKRTAIRSTSMSSINESSSLTDISTNFKEALEEQKRILMNREKKIVLRRRMAEELIARQKRLEEEEHKVREMEKLVCRKSQSLAKKSGLAYIGTEQSKSPVPTQSSSSEQLMSTVVKTTLSTKTVPENSSKVSEEDFSKHSILVSSSGSKVIDYSEGFESPESSETQKPLNSNSIHKPATEAKTSLNKKTSMVAIKVPLSPRLQSRSRQRYSSGSDDSIHFSQTETMSEQSDMEVKISVLKEQLRQRKLEAEKLRREQTRAQRERLKAKEQSLLKQIQAYDTYISQAHKELDRESEICSMPITRPQIKQPKVAEKVTFRRSESQPSLSYKEPRKKSTVSDEESHSIKSVSEASSLETTIQSPGQVQEQDVTKINEEKSDVYLSEDIDEALSQTSISGDSREVKTENSAKNKFPKEEWTNAESFFSEIKESTIVSEIPSAFSNITVRNCDLQFDRKLPPDLHLSSEEQSNIGSTTQIISQEQNKLDELVQLEVCTNKTISDAEVTPEEQFDSIETSEEASKTGSIHENVSRQIIASADLNETNNKSAETYNETIEEFEVGSESSVYSSSLNDLKCVEETESKPKNQSLSDIVLNNQGLESLKSITAKDSIQESNIASLSEVFDNNQEGLVSATSELTKKSTTVDSKLKDKSLISDGKEKYSEKSNLLSVEKDESFSKMSELSETEISDLHSEDEFENEIQDFIKVVVTEKPDTGCEDKLDLQIMEVNKINKLTEAKRKEQIERVTESILNQLLNESFSKVSQTKYSNEEETEGNQNDIVENLTNQVLHRYVKDATNSMINIFQEKRKIKVDVDVRHRVQEIMNESLSSPRSEVRAQDFMVTTYDVLSPDCQSPALSDTGRDLLDAEFFSSVSPTKSSDKVDVNGTGSGTDNEGFWFDEDIGLGRTRREAEELRRQQLQIEQEIQQLEQAQEQIPSYYYVREIPNKPPPPYTPPGQASHSRHTVSHTESIPTQQKKIEALVTQAVQFLCEMKSKNKDLTLVQPPQNFLTEDKSGHVYRKFLFDLVRQLFSEVTSSEHKEDVLPWNKTLRRRKCKISIENKEMLYQFINKQVNLLFEFEPRAIKDNLTIRWSRKKRERVDELLVRETQEEERDWTDYAEDEMIVKNHVAISVWDHLLSETASVLSVALEKKLKYCQQL